MKDQPVRLVEPTDFEILEVMKDGKRQSAPNLAEILDRRSKYMNNRLAELLGHGLVEKVGPAETSGMYEITEEGHNALKFRKLYQHSRASDFGKLVRGEITEQEYKDVQT